MTEMTPDFDEIADQQGWSTETMLFIVRMFIGQRNLGEELAEVARVVAEGENT